MFKHDARLVALLVAGAFFGQAFAQACPENFDAVGAPALPAGWISSFDGASAAWTTSGALVDSPPNAAGISSSPAAVGNSYLDSPPGEQADVFHFRHAYSLENLFDGGVLEISIDGGAFEDILAAGGQFVSGGYNGTISSGSGSPIAGREAWTGSSGGYVTTEVELPPAAIGVSSVLSWRLASDTSVGGGSWYVDSVACGAAPPPPPSPWVYGADYPIPILDQATTAMHGVLYSFGGVSNGALADTAYAYDGSSWSAIAPLPVAVEGPVAVNDGSHIFILGGFDGGGMTNTLYEYVVATNSYTTLAPFSVPTFAHSAVVVNGKIVKFAGVTDNMGTQSNATEIYDIASNTWSTAANYPQALHFVGAFEYGGYVYGVGGVGVGEVESLKTYRYDLAANLWDDAPIPDLPDGRWGAASARLGTGAVVAGGYIGGSDSGDISASAMFWDGPTNQWRALPAMLGERARMSGAVLNGRFTVVGGRSPSGGFTGTTEVQVYDRIFDDFSNTDVAAIADDAYDGTLASMACTDIDTSAIPALDTVTSVTVTTKISHTWAGDLVTKLVSPDGSVLALFNRPGFAEPADDGTGDVGTPANLVATSPLTFADASANDAEQMGETLADTDTICLSDGICDYFPNPGAAATPPARFADLVGETASGIWSLCVGDTFSGDVGTLEGWSITMGHADGGAGTFPPQETFDLASAPALPSGWDNLTHGAGIAWATTATFADTAPNSAHAPDIDETSDMVLDSPAFVPVAGETLTFQHKYVLENEPVDPTIAYDGAVLEISIDGGAFEDLVAAGGSFISGGYNTTVSGDFFSPIAGRPAWAGDSGGFVTTEVELPSAATGLPTVLRFRTADDNSAAVLAPSGWWIDSIQLLSPPAPVIGVTPSTLSATQWADTTTDEILSISNTGTVDLNWLIDEATACATPSDLPWVSVNPSIGPTAPGASSDVTVTFDSTGLAAGNYAGLLCVASDDPVTPLVEIPVDLTVTMPATEFCDGGADTIFCDGFEGEPGNRGAQGVEWK